MIKLYPGYDNYAPLLLEQDGVAYNLSAITSARLVFGEVVVESNNATTDPIRWNQGGYATGELRIYPASVGGIEAGPYEVPLILVSAAWPNGLIWTYLQVEVVTQQEAPADLVFDGDGRAPLELETVRWTTWHPGPNDKCEYVTDKYPVGYTSSLRINVDDYFGEAYWHDLANHVWPGCSDFDIRMLFAMADAEVYSTWQLLNYREVPEGVGVQFFFNAPDAGKISLFLSYGRNNDPVPMRLLGSKVTPACTFTSEEFVWVRLRKVNTALQVKMWADGAAEPSAWDSEVDYGGDPYEPRFDFTHNFAVSAFEYPAKPRRWWIGRIEATFMLPTST